MKRGLFCIITNGDSSRARKRNCSRNNTVNVGGVTRASPGLVVRIPNRKRGILESSTYEADIKTGHEAPWRQATLISRKHSASPYAYGLLATRFITSCNEYSGARGVSK